MGGTVRSNLFGIDKYPPGSVVRIKGERHAKSGQQGIVVRGVPGRLCLLHVQLREGVYLVEGKHLVLIEPGKPQPKNGHERRENLTKIVDQAYKALKAKDSRYAASMDKSIWGNLNVNCRKGGE